jgi:hypothetical protein
MTTPTAVKVTVGGLALALTTAAGSPTPAPDTSASPGTAVTMYDVICDNGQSATVEANPDGTATLNGLPAGTVCSVTIVGGGQAAVALPPVPAGGVASGTFNGPFLRLTPSVGYAGFTTQAVGQGFPPSSAVTVSWNVPGDLAIVVPTDATGGFVASVLVPSGDAAGPRNLRAAAVGDPTVTARYLVQASPFAPIGVGGLEFRP